MTLEGHKELRFPSDCVSRQLESKSPLIAQKEPWSIPVPGMKKTQSLLLEKGIPKGQATLPR